MEVSRDLCSKLASIDPNIRLGYADRFHVVKLFRARDMERSASAPDEWRGRGPIFSKRGRYTPDWDMLGRVPCSIAEIAGDTLRSGKVIGLLKEWTVDIRDSQYLALVKLAQEEDADIDELSTKMADYACWHAQHALKVGEVGPSDTTAAKFRAKKVERDNKNRYWQEIEMLETKWRAEGWKPPHERGL